MTAWTEPDPLFYRYSVKCDRERYHAIEKVARKNGLTATQFVQKHFETILDFVPVEKPAKPAVFEASRSETEVAAQHGISASAVRVYRAIHDAADKSSGHAEIGVGAIADRTGVRPGTVRVLLSRLMDAGHLRRVGTGLRRTAIYEVSSLERAS